MLRALPLIAVTGAVALAGPIAAAGAWTLPATSALPTATLPVSSTLPVTSTLPVFSLPSLGASVVGGNQIGQAGCVGTNRPSVGGNNGSTSAQSCGAVLSFQGAQIGQISAVIGPTIIGSPFAMVNESAGSITAVP